jgi:hypothetical protein
MAPVAQEGDDRFSPPFYASLSVRLSGLRVASRGDMMANVDKQMQRQMKEQAAFLLKFLNSHDLGNVPSDYSKESLFMLDGLIHQLWGEAGPSLALEQMVTVWGSYLGCVFRENYNAEWLDGGKNGPALRLKGKSEITLYPFSIMYKRFVNGSLDPISAKVKQIDAAYYGR